MDEKELERLANMLKKQGLAASYVDARKLAESITKTRKREPVTPKKEAPKQQEPQTLDILEEIKEVEEAKEEPKPEIKERIEKIRPDSVRFNRPDYDITKETKTLKELMAEDAEKIYKEAQQDSESFEDISEDKGDVVEEGKKEEKEKEEELEKEVEEPCEEEKAFDDI